LFSFLSFLRQGAAILFDEGKFFRLSLLFL
jgi:hypothetical protein